MKTLGKYVLSGLRVLVIAVLVIALYRLVYQATGSDIWAGLSIVVFVIVVSFLAGFIRRSIQRARSGAICQEN